MSGHATERLDAQRALISCSRAYRLSPSDLRNGYATPNGRILRYRPCIDEIVAIEPVYL